MKFLTELTSDRTIIINDNNWKMTIFLKKQEIINQNKTVYLSVVKDKLKSITTDIPENWEQLIAIEFSKQFNQETIKDLLINQTKLAQMSINDNQELPKIIEELMMVLKRIGYQKLFTDGKRTTGKAPHRWNAAISKMQFTAEVYDSYGQIYWSKRAQVILKAGARLKKNVSLNKDGSVGFAAKFGLTLRNEHQADIEDYVTTRDITLKSINEVGSFLYFAGLNSWKVFKNADGLTIDEIAK